MADLTAIGVNLIALGVAFLSAVKFYQKILKIEESQGENLRQIKAIWKKLDHLDSLADSRLDRIERQLNYLAGVQRIELDNLRGNRD